VITFATTQKGKAIQDPIRGLDRPHITYPAFVKALKEVGCKGYCNLEFCPTLLSEDHRILGIERIDGQVQLFFEYMTNLIKSA